MFTPMYIWILFFWSFDKINNLNAEQWVTLNTCVSVWSHNVIFLKDRCKSDKNGCLKMYSQNKKQLDGVKWRCVHKQIIHRTFIAGREARVLLCRPWTKLAGSYIDVHGFLYEEQSVNVIKKGYSSEKYSMLLYPTLTITRILVRFFQVDFLDNQWIGKRVPLTAIYSVYHIIYACVRKGLCWCVELEIYK